MTDTTLSEKLAALADVLRHSVITFGGVEQTDLGPQAAADLIAARQEVERLLGLLREAEAKLTDVQGAFATKQYAANLLTRIRSTLQEPKP